MTKNIESPRTLTGGQAVHPTPDNKAVVDWLQVTFKGKKTWGEILAILGLEKVEFNHFEKAYYGYSNMYGMNNINIMFNDELTEYHVQMTGSGCRMFEQVTESNWYLLFQYIHADPNAKLTRLDLALDNFDKPFTIPTIKGKCDRGELVTKFLKGRGTKEWDFSSENLGPSETAGDGVEFGRRASRLMIRMYDKKLERQNNGLDVTVDSWLRVEIQLRKEYSNEALKELIENGFQVGITAKGYLKEYIRFVNRSKDTNKRRWKDSMFWVKYLKGIEPLKLSLDAPDFTIEKSIKWADHSFAPTFATIRKAKGDDFMSRWIEELFEQGEERMKPKHDAMVNDYKQAEELATINNLVSWEFAKQKKRDERNERYEEKKRNEEMKKAPTREEKALQKKMNDQMIGNYFEQYSMSTHVKEIPEFTSVLNEKLEPRIKLLDKTNE